jgi:carboxylesterase
MSSPVLPGAEAWSHEGALGAGVLTLHGFTGNPSSMRGVAEALAGAGFHIELPRLPGHGTALDDMIPTRWDDWTAEVEAAYQRLAARTDSVVVAGLSMGGSLTLWTGLQHPEVAGLVCVNPATVPPAPEVVDMLAEMVADGSETMPGIGSDIADPDVVEIAYEGTPLRALQSLMTDGLVPMSERYGELKMPLRLFTSHQDHVVEPAGSEFLAAHYGGTVEHTWLERSYHVATQDYDRDLIFAETVEFATRVTSQSSTRGSSDRRLAE